MGFKFGFKNNAMAMPNMFDFILHASLVLILRSMCDHAWNWAKETGHWRRNPIHGEEEVNIVVEDFFCQNDQQGSSQQQQGTFDMEDIPRSSFSVMPTGYLWVSQDNMHSLIINIKPNCSISIYSSKSIQDPDGSLLDNHAIPDRLRGLVPQMAGEVTDPHQGVPGSFK